MPLNEILAIASIVSFFVLLAAGIPVAITLAVTGFVFGYLGFGAGLFNLLPARIFGVTANYTLIAIPLFVFMGVMLEKSRIADELMDVIGHLAGGLRGGMGIGIILFGVLMGATTGIVGATIVTLGLLSLPALMRRAITCQRPVGRFAPPARWARSCRRASFSFCLRISQGNRWARCLPQRFCQASRLLEFSASICCFSA